MKNLKVGISELVELSKLNPSEINRAIDENHIKRFTAKLNKYNWLDPIKVDNQYNILEGHHRYYAALKMGQQAVPVYKVYWYDNLSETQRLSIILAYNAGNLNWSPKDYLEKYGELENDYKEVHDIFLKYKETLTVGTVINLYLTKKRNEFKSGGSKIHQKELADFLCQSLSNLVVKYKKKKCQAYSLREVTKICLFSKSIKASRYILNRYEGMLEDNHSAITSISDFRPYINNVYAEYNKILND